MTEAKFRTISPPPVKIRGDRRRITQVDPVPNLWCHVMGGLAAPSRVIIREKVQQRNRNRNFSDIREAIDLAIR